MKRTIFVLRLTGVCTRGIFGSAMCSIESQLLDHETKSQAGPLSVLFKDKDSQFKDSKSFSNSISEVRVATDCWNEKLRKEVDHHIHGYLRTGKGANKSWQSLLLYSAYERVDRFGSQNDETFTSLVTHTSLSSHDLS